VAFKFLNIRYLSQDMLLKIFASTFNILSFGTVQYFNRLLVLYHTKKREM